MIASRSTGRVPTPTTFRAACALVLLSAAVVLFASARRALGPQWSIQARTIARHRLIRTGPYAVVRHPIYVALGLFLVAVGVVAATWWAFVVALALYAIGTRLRIGAEERLLARQCGPDFQDYRQQVPALIPRRRTGNPSTSTDHT